jgi:hypothetical protein
VRSLSTLIVGLVASPIGIVVLAALDSTLLFSLPGGIDPAVLLLAARRHTVAWMVALLATGGSMILPVPNAAPLSVHAGQWLWNRIGRRRLRCRLRQWLRRRQRLGFGPAYMRHRMSVQQESYRSDYIVVDV